METPESLAISRMVKAIAIETFQVLNSFISKNLSKKIETLQ
jgi:hypothetical protein